MSLFRNNQNSKKYYEEFAAFFQGMMPAVYKIKRIGHIASGVTEFAVVYQLSSTNLPIGAKLILIALSLLIAGFITVMIEVGIDNFFPYFCKQIIQWKFPNKWFRAMFWVITIFFIIPLSISSPTLSWYGGNEIVDNLMKAPNAPFVDSINIEFTKESSSIISKQEVTAKQIAQLYSDKIQSIKTKYASLMQKKQVRYKELSKLDIIEHPWAPGSMNKVKKEIAQLKAKRDADIPPIITERNQKILDLDSSVTSNINYLRTQKDNQIERIHAQHDKGVLKRDNKAKLWGGLMGYFAAIGGFVVFASILVIELYKAGAAIEDTLANQEAKKSFFLSNFINIFKEKSGKVAAPKVLPIARRQIGFEITNEAASGKAANLSKSGKTPRNIAASTNELPPKSGKRQSSKAAKTSQKVTTKNRQLVINTAKQIAAKNGGKVLQKEVIQMTGLAERTVRKYWKEAKTYI